VLGQVRPGDRDLAALGWIGEQYGVPLELFGRLLSRLSPDDAADRAARLAPVRRASATLETAREAPGLQLARKHAARLEAARLASRVRTWRGVWLIPTRKGLRFAGLPYQTWQPQGSKLVHVETVARLRFWLEEHYPDADWQSERAIRSRWAGTGARVRKADGELVWPDGRRVGIEVELHLKPTVTGGPSPYEAILHDVDQDYAACWWFAPPPLLAPLERLFSQIPWTARLPHRVLPLPEEVAS